MKAVAIIQARMGSKRLPNKMLLHLHGYPIIEWVYRRILKSNRVDKIIFAIPESEENHILSFYLKKIGAEVFEGSETDLVDRFYHAAKLYKAKNIIRICADNPLVCSSAIDSLVDFYDKTPCDYAFNHIPRNNNWPDGLGAEICSIDLLEDIYLNSTKSGHREHIFNYIWDNKSDYTIKTFDPIKEIVHPELKFDVDTMDDYQRLLEKPYRIDMSALEIIQTAFKY
jgi:spore coat polysaccharide biosynthesis protein SpsF